MAGLVKVAIIGSGGMAQAHLPGLKAMENVKVVGFCDVNLERAQAMADALPHARMVVVPGGGHASNLTHPEPVNAALMEFLGTL